jgi:hypothetical protein
MGRCWYLSIGQPIREGLTWNEKWCGPDEGLIWCWERGRQERLERPDVAARADRGELVSLDWKGGTEEPESKKKRGSSTKKSSSGAMKDGSLQYLATWQGLRGEDLDIDVDGKRTIVCSKTKQTVEFRKRLRKDKDCLAGGSPALGSQNPSLQGFLFPAHSE